MNEKLKPCPKCSGKSASLMRYVIDSTNSKKCILKCRLCGFATPEQNTESEAVNFWNDMAQSPAKKLAQLVQDMRNTQKRYFKTRDKDALIESKRLEAQVDKYAAEILQMDDSEMKDLLSPLHIENDVEAVNVEALADILEWLSSAVKLSNGSGVRLFAKSVGEAKS